MSPAMIWIASLLVFPLAGAPLLLHPSFRRCGLTARVVLAGAVGAIAVSWMMNLEALARWRWHLAPLVALSFALCAALRLFVRDGERASSLSLVAGPKDGALSGLEWTAIAICTISVLAALGAALSASATSPDLLLFWGTKAEAFAAARTIDDDFLGEPFLRFLHTSYPPLVTNVYAFASIAAGGLSWMAAAATFPLQVAAMSAALPGILRSRVSRAEALIATAAITASFGLLGDVLDIAGNADMPLLLFELLAIALLMGPDGQLPSGQLLAGVLLGGAAASKVEGVAFVAAAALFFLAFQLRPPRRRKLPGAAARLLIPTALSLAAWFAFGRQRHLFKGYETYGATLDVHFERIGLVGREIASSLGAAAWGLPWLLPLAALAAARRGVRIAVYPLSAAGALTAFFFFTYLHGGPDPTLWIRWSAGRIFVVVSALLVLAVTAAWRGPAGNGGEPARARATRG